MKTVEQPITPSQVDAVIKHAPTPLAKVLLQVAAETGMRTNEVCRLEWRSVDLVDELITLPTKTGPCRWIPITSLAFLALLSLPSDVRGVQQFVFPHSKLEGQPIAVATAVSWWRTALTRAGLPPLPMSAMRMAFMANLMRMDLPELMFFRIAGCWPDHPKPSPSYFIIEPKV